MTITMTATETKAKLLSLLDEVADGEDVLITKHGRVVARLVPAGTGNGARLRGMFAGQVRVTDPDDDLYSTGERWEIEEA